MWLNLSRFLLTRLYLCHNINIYRVSDCNCNSEAENMAFDCQGTIQYSICTTTRKYYNVFAQISLLSACCIYQNKQWIPVLHAYTKEMLQHFCYLRCKYFLTRKEGRVVLVLDLFARNMQQLIKYMSSSTWDYKSWY